ncbi:hypothetical protein B0T16DRAFT_226268 [Cercophora newfieldiana]|uniref:Uncharacterized protein n=1 Tax=Cercophora newfieldiana TaxID=92897 RepID=A0AA39XQX0_9PEZI|nr:hypothetical protein B0T16DRAFT_226268 [Cercophora newfieldiana]
MGPWISPRPLVRRFLIPLQKRALQPRMVWVLADAGGSAGPWLMLPPRAMTSLTTSRLLAVLSRPRWPDAAAGLLNHIRLQSLYYLGTHCSYCTRHYQPVTQSGSSLSFFFLCGFETWGPSRFLLLQNGLVAIFFGGKNAHLWPAKHEDRSPFRRPAMLRARQKTPGQSCVPRQDNRPVRRALIRRWLKPPAWPTSFSLSFESEGWRRCSLIRTPPSRHGLPLSRGWLLGASQYPPHLPIPTKYLRHAQYLACFACWLACLVGRVGTE